jgi:hypothetical protein
MPPYFVFLEFPAANGFPRSCADAEDPNARPANPVFDEAEQMERLMAEVVPQLS